MNKKFLSSAAAKPSSSSSPSSPEPVENIYNIPNALSVARIAATPVLGGMILTGQYEIAAYMFGIAAISDVLDGFIARRFNQQTVVGTFLDPMSDKFLAITVTATLGWNALLSPVRPKKTSFLHLIAKRQKKVDCLHSGCQRCMFDDWNNCS